MTNKVSVGNFIEKFFHQHPDINNQGAYALAVSGGPDSMALAHAMCEWSRIHEKEIYVLTVDHGLRTEAKAEAQAVSEWVNAQKSSNITHHTLTWKGEKPDTSIMEAARNARYQLIKDYCVSQKIQCVFVAHHQDDQAETFLIRLAKGSGLDGLSCMQDLREEGDSFSVARPFLRVSKQDLVDYCKVNDVRYFSDPSNENEDYLRPRLRQSMTILEGEGLSAKRLSTLSYRLGRARRALEEISEQKFQECLIEQCEEYIHLDFLKTQQQTEEIAFRIVQLSVQGLRKGEPYNVRMDRLEDLFNSLWLAPELFKPRTLGGLIFALKSKNSALYIGREIKD